MSFGDPLSVEFRMLSESMTISTLDGSAVLCEADQCDKPALYLFLATSVGPDRAFSGMQQAVAKPTALLCSAYCEVHALESAERAGLALPIANRDARHRFARATD
jgi:hypothetical protein